MSYIGRKPTNAAITASDIADGIITTAKIAADAVTDAKIADDVVGTEHLTDGEVVTAAVADDAITLAKMASGTDGNIISYDASGNPVAIATGSDGQVLTSTGAGSPPAFEAVSAGKILQVVSATDETIRTTTSAASAGWHTASNTLTVNITPGASTSKVIVLCGVSYRVRDREFAFTIWRDGTSGTNLGNSDHGLNYIENTGNDGHHTTFTVIDSPSTTSQKTYALYVKNLTALTDGTCNINSSRDGDKATKSYIIAMEVGA